MISCRKVNNFDRGGRGKGVGEGGRKRGWLGDEGGAWEEENGEGVGRGKERELMKGRGSV